MLNVITNDLTYRYPSGTELSFPDFSLSYGENMLILGKSGCGKTTMLHLLAGILTPVRGDVFYKEVGLNDLKPAHRDVFRGKNIGMIFQRHIFIEGISIAENLNAVRKLAGNPTDKEWLSGLLDILQIGHLAHKKPSELSEGELQRFSIARAMANKPSWVLADEPTSSLDNESCEDFVSLMKLSELHHPVSWIIATHDTRLQSYFKIIYKL